MKKIITLTFGLCLALSLHAKDYYANGYTIVSEEATHTDDINQIIYISFNNRVKTVKRGLNALLNGTGYRLASDRAADPEIKRLYTQPFPNYKRELGPMKLSAALEMIAGESWRLVVDDVNKLVSFELHEKYKCFTKGVELCPL